MSMEKNGASKTGEHAAAKFRTGGFSTVRSSKLYQKIAQQIAKSIQAGVYPVGGKLPPERNIAQQMNVSRPSLREALITLEIMGLVDIKPGSGIYVKSQQVGMYDNSEGKMFLGASVFEVLDARMAIEGEVVAIVARRATPQLIEKLETANEKMLLDCQVNNQNITTTDDGDFLFHSAIAESTNNQPLSNIVMNLWQEMRNPLFVHTNEVLQLRDNAIAAIEGHRRIVSAISKRDVVGARIAMRDHIAHVEDFLMRDLRNN